jgi:hypothetical protein
MYMNRHYLHLLSAKKKKEENVRTEQKKTDVLRAAGEATGY